MCLFVAFLKGTSRSWSTALEFGGHPSKGPPRRPQRPNARRPCGFPRRRGPWPGSASCNSLGRRAIRARRGPESARRLPSGIHSARHLICFSCRVRLFAPSPWTPLASIRARAHRVGICVLLTWLPQPDSRRCELLQRPEDLVARCGLLCDLMACRDQARGVTTSR